jgi:hypothetical protein
MVAAPPLLYYPDFYPDPTWLRSVLLLNDKVCRIVPRDVQLEDPEPLKQIAGELGALSRISPERVHTEPYAESAEWLNRALGIIAEELRSRGESRKLQMILSGGTVQFSGHVFVYDVKLSHRVREMLTRHGLLDSKLQHLATKLHGELPGVLIPVAAANAVLSFIADSIARERGLTAITDQTVDFAMNTLLGLNVPVRTPAGADEGILAGVLATILIPKEIGQIRFSDYKIIRERSADLRVAFGEFVHACSETARLRRIESTAHLQQRVHECAKVVAEELTRFQTGTAAALRFIRDWWPLTIGGLLSLAKDFVPPEWALTAGAAGQVVKFVHQVTAPSSDRNKETVFNLAAELGNDIHALQKVSQLMTSHSTRSSVS